MNQKVLIMLACSLVATILLVLSDSLFSRNSRGESALASAHRSNNPHSNKENKAKAKIASRATASSTSLGSKPNAKGAGDSGKKAHDSLKHAKSDGTKASAPLEIDVAKASIDDIRKALSKWRSCYETECPTLPYTDPKSHDFAVGEKLRGILSEVAHRARENGWVDTAISEIAREHLQNHDGHVQSAAIDLLSTQPKDVQSLDALLKHVIDGYDAVLVEKALPEVRRYLGGKDDVRIHETLRRAMTTGAPFVSATVSSKIQPFLTQESVDGYASLLPTLDPGSVVTKSLRSALADFSKRQSGG